MRAVLAVVVLSAALTSQTNWQRIESIGMHWYAACAYDAARQQVVLFGGTNSDGVSQPERTWLWNGTQWTTPGPATHMPKLFGAAMAYDSQRQRLVLFGGASGPVVNTTWHNATWEWDGTSWLPTNPAVRPAARQGHRMVFDSARGRIVLFGGVSGINPTVQYTDTWEWDGASWALRTPASQPSTSSGNAMAYDSARSRTVLFQGSSSTAATWEWDGNNWQQAAGAQPPARRYAVMAYDPSSQRVLMFGGADSTSTPLDDLWRWNGVTWQQLTPSVRPAARWNASGDYDVSRGALVVFGGEDATRETRSDTWEWNGTQWTERDPEGATHAQHGHGLAYDSFRNRIVLFGGYGRSFTSRDQTWEFDGSRWSRVFTQTTPPAREEFGIAYDPLRREVVMFGGLAGNTTVPQGTWVYDGVDWRLRQPALEPAATQLPSMTFDAQRGRVLLFGGTGLAQTWEWDGSTWTRRNPAHSPPQRLGAGLAHDLVRGRIVLFGGWYNAYLNDTWEWDGTDWTQRSPATQPPGRNRTGMAYDAVRERVVLFGGEGAGQVRLGDTWEWDGTDWQALTPTVTPPGSCSHAMVFDSGRGRITLHGGNSLYALHSTTWDWFTPAPGTAVSFGSGCPGSSGLPQLGTEGRRPWLGSNFTVVAGGLPANALVLLAIGLSDTAWSGGALPQPLAGFGMPGCTLLISLDVTLLVQATGSTARITTPIPNDPRLLGMVVFHQLAALDPPANTAGLVTSAGLRSQLGLR